MDVQEIVAELKTERERLNQAIATLEDLGSGQETAKSRTPIKTAAVGNMRQAGKSTRGRMTPEGRKRLSEAMKKRWAARRKSA
jgi:hypothetical protein